MHKLDGHRAFPNRGGDAFDATGACIAGREDAWHARFQQVGGPWKGPACDGQISGAQIRSGFDETAVVERHATLEPLRMGRGAGHQKDMPDLVSFRRGIRALSPPTESFESITSL